MIQIKINNKYKLIYKYQLRKVAIIKNKQQMLQILKIYNKNKINNKQKKIMKIMKIIKKNNKINLK